MRIFTTFKHPIFIMVLLLTSQVTRAQYVPVKPNSVIDPTLSTTSGSGVGDERPKAYTRDKANNLYIAGGYDYSVFLMKVSAAGTVDWQRTIYTGSGSAGIYDVFESNDGNIHFITTIREGSDLDPGAGTVKDATAYLDIARIVFSPAGNYISHQKLTQTTGNPEHYLRKVTHDAEGNVYISGESYTYSGISGTRDFDPGAGVVEIINNKGYIAKYNTTGQLVWAKVLPTEGLRGLEVDAAGHVYATGWFSNSADFDGNGVADLTSAGSTDIFFVKYDKDNGNLLWAYNFGGTGDDSGLDILQNKDGNIVLTGYYNPNAAGIDFDPSAGTVALKTYTPNRYSLFAGIYTTGGDLLSAHRISDDYTFYYSAFIHDLYQHDDGQYYVSGSNSDNYSVDLDKDASVTALVNPHAGFWARYNASFDFDDVILLDGYASVLHAFPLDNNGNEFYVIGTYKYSVDLDPNQGSTILSSNRTSSSGYYFQELFAAKYCTLPATIPNNIWSKYIKQGTTNITLSVKPQAGATSYVWTLPSGFTITAGDNTNSITVTADATAVSGDIKVVATNGCGPSDPYTFAVTTGAMDVATLTFNDITKTYGDPTFMLNATSNSTGAITYEEVADTDNIITLNGSLVTINKAGTVKLAARVAGDATYGDGAKEITLTVNKKLLTAKANNQARSKGEVNPEFGITYGTTATPFGNSLHFDGVNDYAYAFTNNIHASITSEMTFEAWINTATIIGTQGVVNEYIASYSGFGLFISNGQLSAVVVDKNISNKNIQGGVIKPNEWTHIAFTYKAGDKMIGYINGEPIGIRAAGNDLGTNPYTSVYIGGGVYNNQFFNGAIDEVRIWNVARTPEQIRNYMNTTVQETSAGLLAYLNFNHGIASGDNDNPTINKALDLAGDNDFTLNDFTLSGTTSNWVKGFTRLNATGFKNGEDASVLDTKPTATTTATISSAPGEYPITLSGGSDDNYTFNYINGILTVNKVPAMVTLSNLSTTYNGSAFEATVTTEPADLPVTITYNGSSEKPVGAGTYSVEAVINSIEYQGSAYGTLVINKADQTLTFEPLSDKKIGDEPFALNASASSGLEVVYTSSNPSVASITGNTVTVKGPGTTTIKAAQSGGINYKAVNVKQTFKVKNIQTITFDAIPEKTFGDQPFALKKTSSAGLIISYSSSDPAVATVSGNTVTLTGRGTAIITATQEGNDNFVAATPVEQTLTVKGAILSVNPALSFEPVLTGKTDSKSLVITNTGDADLVISNITYPAGYSGDKTSASVAPNESLTITVTFAPTEVKTYNGNIELTVNTAEGNVTVALTGEGVTITGTEPTLSEQTEIYPVPVGESLTVETALENATVQVTDVAGKPVSSIQVWQKDKTTYTLNLASLSAGTYFLHISQGNQVVVKRFIKQ